VPFFAIDPRTGQEREFKQTSEAFRKAADKLAWEIEKLFEAMLRGKEQVFVARTAFDASEERETIIREIRAKGFVLSPRPDGAMPRGLDTRTVRGFIEEARSTVHVLGAASDPEVREQIDLALTAGKKVIFYLARGHEAATAEQKKLIEDIRENRWGLRAGTWVLLESRSVARLRQDLIGSLAPSSPSAAAAKDGVSRVYLLCDPTTPPDVEFAREVQQGIQSAEGIHVDLPPAAAASSSPGTQHERLLRECDGLLLYHEQAPRQWYSRNFADLLWVEQRADRRLLKSKAVLVGRTDIAYPGLTVIERRDPFEIGQLEPFLAPLRRATDSREGAASAGR
jgi:hypothetical protein